MEKIIIEEIEDNELLEEMTNLSEEDKMTISFEDAKKILGWD